MDQILAIDPGLRATGLAWTGPDGEVLVCTSRPAEWREISAKVEHVRRDLPFPSRGARYTNAQKVGWDVLVIELPQVYVGGRMVGDPAHLVRLTLLVGGLLCTIPHQRSMLVHPATWKGQVPKNIHHQRIRARVSDSVKGSKDALDAAGLWLYASDVLTAETATFERRREGDHDEDPQEV